MNINKPRVLLLSISGMDGAGKTTQIDLLQRDLNAVGTRVSVLRFWNDIAVLSVCREKLAQLLFRGDSGTGSPARPIQRRDKNVSSWYMVFARFALYLLDALNMNRVAGKARAGHPDVVIFDRYIYDELANLPLHTMLGRFYARCLLKLAAKPDIAFLLDADPYLASRRKPEYPVEFLRRNRDSYLALSRPAGMKVIDPLPLPDVSQRIMKELLQWRRVREKFVRNRQDASTARIQQEF